MRSVINILSHFYSFNKRAGVIVSSLVLITGQSFAASEHLTGFEMSSCSFQQCNILIVKDRVEKSILATLFAFADAKLIHIDKKNNSRYVLNAKEGYYDPSQSEIVLRNIKERQGADSVVDLKSGKITYYVKTNKGHQ